MPEELGSGLNAQRLYNARLDDLDECCADCKRWGEQWQMGLDNVPFLACPTCGIQRIREAYERRERA